MSITLERLEAYLAKIKTNAPSTALVDFSRKNPDLEQLQQILRALITSSVCRTLNLSVNNFNQEACELIAVYLANNPSIETLLLSGNTITSDTAIILFQALCFNTNLRSLYLNDNLIDDDAIYHIQQLRHFNITLQKIDLTYNKLSLQGLICLSNFTESQCEIYISKQLRDFNFEQPHSLIDPVKRTIINRFQQQLPVAEIFFICALFDDIREKSITMLLRFPPGDERDELLRYIGNLLFTLPPPKDIQGFLEKAYAHICFAAITTQNYGDKMLLIENYRSLVSGIGLTQEKDFRKWKNSVKLKLYPITKFADQLIATLFHTLTRPDQVTHAQRRSINTSLEILYSYKNKIFMQQELKTTHDLRNRIRH